MPKSVFTDSVKKTATRGRSAKPSLLRFLLVGTASLLTIARSFNATNVSSWKWLPDGRTLSMLDIESLASPTFPQAIDKSSKIKIIGFADSRYRDIAMTWYQRLSNLGYNEHTIITTDQLGADFFAHNVSSYRFEKMIVKITEGESHMRVSGKLRRERERMFAMRWHYILSQLEQGISVVLTDMDNIFNRHVNLSEFLEYDVIHAYEKTYPQNVFEKQGFVVCGGMSFIKSSPAAIRFVKLIVDGCGTFCDDQVVLNNLLLTLNITWDNTDHLPPPENRTSESILPKQSMTGIASATGHTVKVWSRDFAFRGDMYPEECPVDNWVSMPWPVQPRGISWTRQNIHVYKHRMFQQWDDHCGRISNQTATDKPMTPTALSG
ncbi:Nucleotide-diphospho-sugar transferase [Seminavis robusta]|uniref:Nucleotide-diphospho-sugar transferase n=1 Tax=Seminavis robusta TaxID=568900 RepID=A0A9N8D7H4_9STRA|nr:Nucleotide-diphospho-sugar transferase [Seminavis robusta]|eukprot:Sro25_g017100.1 Nucleotide-diphospho-sugar transferase (378) ;mRNA; r:114705-115987